MTRATGAVELDVVIPVRTGVEFLPEAVASASTQIDATVHVIVVDDGADPDPAVVLAGVGGVHVTVIANSGPPGIAGARNAGAAVGRSPLLAFLDADDTWPATRTAALLALLDAGHGLAFGAVELTDRDGRSVGREHAPVVGAGLMRREVWDAVGGFDPVLGVGEFIDWMSRARALGIAEGRTDATALRRRSHDGNMTRTAPTEGYVAVARAHLRRRRLP